KLMRARSEVDHTEYLSWLACLELANLEAVLDAGGVDAKGDEEEEEDGEAGMAGRAKDNEEEREAKRAKSEEEEAEVEVEVEREGQEEAAKRAEREEVVGEAPGGFRVLPRRAGSGLGRIAQRKREKMAAKRVAKGKMRRG
ncbi:hypothetical protein C0991_010753, partial [Blastosporella zonata]